MNSGRRGGGVAGKGLAAAPAAAPPAGSWQPPRILVVDIHPPHWAHTCHKLCEALENVFCLACSLTGPPRIPLLSLYAVQSQQECLLPLVPVRGNFPRLQSCIAELRTLPAEGAFPPKEGALIQAVQDGLQQFKQYTGQGMAGASLNSFSVEITVLTSQLSAKMAKQLEAGLQGVDLLSLRQLQVVEISRGTMQGPSDDAECSSCPGEGAASSSSSSSESAMILGLAIDLQTVENDVVALETFFKAWFHDHSTDQEHLHLLLPAGVISHSAAAKISLVCVKCDTQERLLSPALFPAACSSGGESMTRVDNASSPFWMAAGQGLAPRKLRVLRAMEAEGLCASLLFGLPLVVRPTNCWQLNWDELEANQHRFQALCHCLRKREWVLLAKYEPQQEGAGPGPGPSTNSYQVLRPSSDAAAASSLLLCSVVVRELLLPSNIPLLPADPPEAALRDMEGILDGLDMEPAYNPLSVTSHLYRVLKSNLGRPLASRSQRRAERHLPRQQASRSHPSKARATVAPLPMLPPTASPAVLSLFSSEEEFLDSM
ncbi:meiosis 1 arrest protein [Rhineura floridana]|uniref:meiosis 1 arrest protein n=1 Tax=Rhineura floridana TaxID=261503 RepID=UPI002AC84C41|nr:meiosis 1 arrest protein [Rhineura floridana]